MFPMFEWSVDAIDLLGRTHTRAHHNSYGHFRVRLSHIALMILTCINVHMANFSMVSFLFKLSESLCPLIVRDL